MLFFGGYSEATHNFSAPTLADMRSRLARALRDEGDEVFNNDDLTDFLRAAIVEVSRVYPKEIIETFDLIADLYDYPTGCETIWRVEMLRSDAFFSGVPMAMDEALGWDLYAGHIYLPRTLAFVEDTDAIRVWGYAVRDAPGGALGDATPMDVDQEAEQGVRTFAMLEAYSALVNDRARFAQWNALPSNTDVTMAQMEALVASQQQHWESVRKRLAHPRRS